MCGLDWCDKQIEEKWRQQIIVVAEHEFSNIEGIDLEDVCGLWFTNSSCVLPTCHVVYQLINHRNLWSIA